MKIKSFTHFYPKNEVRFVRIKLFYAELSPFSNSTLYGAIVSNTQYSTSGDFIYSDNTNSTVFFKNYSMQRTWIFKHSLRRYRQSFSQGYIMYCTQVLFRIVFLNTRYLFAYYFSNQINKLLNKYIDS